jgi:hypothetical protein
MADLIEARAPDSLPEFRRGQLLVLLAEFDDPLTIDRIGYLEFFASNPHLVIRDGPDAVRLELRGFSPDALKYQSAPERYVNQRSRLRSDLAALTAWGYAQPSSLDGRIVCGATRQGREAAATLTSLYSDAFRASIQLVTPLFRGSDTAIARKVREWLNVDDFHVDLLDLEMDDPSALGPEEESA